MHLKTNKNPILALATAILMVGLMACTPEEGSSGSEDAPTATGSLIVSLSTAFDDVSADSAWTKTNSNTFAVYLYTESSSLAASTGSDSENLTINAPPTTYNALLLAGNRGSNADVYMLAAGIQRNVRIEANENTEIAIALKPIAFNFDFQGLNPDDPSADIVDTFSVSFDGSFPVSGFSLQSPPTVQLGSGDQEALNVTENGQTWAASVTVQTPVEEATENLVFNSRVLTFSDESADDFPLNKDSLNWKLFMGTTDPYTNSYSLAVFIDDPNLFTVCSQGCNYSGIQSAIDSLNDDNKIKLEAGVYAEDITVNKRISIIGSGSGAGGTVLKGASAGNANVNNGIIQLKASGHPRTEPILFQDLQLEVDMMAGFSVGLHNLDTSSDSISFIKLKNVVVTGNNGNPEGEKERGFYVSPTSTLKHLEIIDSSFTNMTYGWYFHKKVSSETSTVEDVKVSNTSFNHNFVKGIYAEKLSEAFFSECQAVNNGYTTGTDAGDVPDYRIKWLTGIDINLKAGDYKNITFYNCKIDNNGHGYNDKGEAKAVEGAGIAVKARNDGDTYGANPATLDRVTIFGGSIINNERGLRLGEPGKDNAGPTNVIISYVNFSNNIQVYDGTDDSESGNLINQTITTANADYNYWGGEYNQNYVVGNVTVTNSFATEADLNSVRYLVENTSTGIKYPTIQQAIDAADTGDTIEADPGTFTERILIDKPLTLRGATYTFNKNGYAIPANYAWDESVESIINNPDPESTSNLVDIKDTSNVVFEGFVVQSLNALESSQNDHLLRIYADSTAIENITIRNNVIGPNTNLQNQNGTNGRMGLYLALPNYGDYDITNSLITGNKIFDAKGNGNNLFIWGGAYNYSSVQRGDLSGTVIEDNEISGSHRSGIEIAGSADNLTIRNNSIHSNSGNEDDLPDELKYGNGIVIIRMGSDKTYVEGEGPRNLIITGNEIYNNEKNGIYLGPINSGHVISHNKIYGNGWDAVRIDLYESYHSGATPVFDITSDITLSNNSIQASAPNHGAGVIVDASDDAGFRLSAQENWWGDVNGPCTPDSTGDCGSLISDYINFDNWLTSDPN